jgi:hypothetical protein
LYISLTHHKLISCYEHIYSPILQEERGYNLTNGRRNIGIRAILGKEFLK